MNVPPKSCRVGILIWCYNAAATIAETLKSIQQQDALGELTGLYLADNASTDDTIKISRAVWKAPPTLTILPNQRNEGQAANVNRAFRALSDQLDWILVLNADDLAKPHWLRLMLERIGNCSERVASISSSWDDLYPDGTIVPGQDEPGRLPVLNPGTTAEVRRTLLVGCWWHISGCAIRVRAFREVGEVSHELPNRFDWEWLVRCLEYGWDVEYIPRTLILYRQHAASVTTACFKENRDISDALQVVTQHRDALLPNDWLRFHSRLLVTCLRRIARALSRVDFDRVARCSRAAVEVVGSCIRHGAKG